MDRDSLVVRFGLGLATVLFLIGGPICGFFLLRIFLEARVSSNWPSVIGTVTKAQVGETEVKRYFADVAYTYRVNDRDFTGNRIRASDGEYNIRDGAVQAISGLTVGQQRPVYFNPTHPQQALLQPGAGFQEYALLFVPVVMIAMGIRALLVLLPGRPPRGPRSVPVPA
ncbi:MAG TPA: DUF3592 domain-containing protein [Pirellulaceae bacterium]|nr:DUF3592 domain-containing protein [Pirellulaceae bacterium]